MDGEGVTRDDGTHEYVLLSVGARSLHRDGVRLTYEDIFPFLYACFLENPDAAYVGFALGYDFCQWFKDLPEERARMLLTEEGIARRRRKKSKNPAPFPVRVRTREREWEIDLHAGKRFKIRPSTAAGNHPRCKCKEERCGCSYAAPWMYVCDAFAFYQSSFLVAIDPASWPEPLVTDEEYEVIKEGKELRPEAQLDADMIRYNTLENEVMARMMSSLNDGFVRMGIKLKRNQWYGPGQAVAEWLRNIGAPTGDDVRETVPEIARNAARKSYYGGWFEIFAHGHITGTAWEYDLNSAYVWFIARLPCLLHGKWSHGYGDVPSDHEYALVHATVTGSDERCGTMLHRTPHGRVLRPSNTSGWYWTFELNAAREAGLIDAVHVDEWVGYDPCDCPPPLRAIADLYQERLRVGKKTPEGRALRLVFNSCYGKMAQSVGKPKYANPIYASLITAGCRTAILQAISTHPRGTRDLLMVATDGVYFRSRHPSLPISPSVLGLWDETERHNLTLMMPGIYWDDTTRERIKEGKSPKLKSRGVNAKDLAACIEELDEAFTTFAEQFDAQESINPWPELTSHVTFSMVSAKQALSRGKWFLCGHVSFDSSRTISADPSSKRWWLEDNPALCLSSEDGVVWTFPYAKLPELESTPYDRAFGDSLLLFADDAMTPDGSVWDSLREKITG